MYESEETPGGAAYGHEGEVDEREMDLLLRLMGMRAARALDPADAGNAAFFDWYAHEARAQLDEPERQRTDDTARGFAERLHVRTARRRSGMRLVQHAPSSRPPVAEGALSQIVGVAARLRLAPSYDLAVAAGTGRELWEEACERWIDIPDGVPDGEHVALTVAGDSMHPLLHAGDVILVRLGPEAASNDIVVARLPDDGYVVKRVGRVSDQSLELTSLNPAYRPMTVPRSERLVLGTVMLRWCSHEHVAAAAS